MEFIIDMFMVVEAKDKEEASSIAFEAVNAKLPEGISRKIKRFSYDGGYNRESIREFKDEL